MSKRKLDKTDIGEMYHWASCALNSGFLKIQIDSDHAMELCERALDNNRLTEENAKLREVLESIVSESEHSWIDLDACIVDAKQLLNQLRDQNNDK